jgi:hypothetical protein
LLLAFPVIAFLKETLKDIKKIIFVSLMLSSLLLFYFQAVSSFYLSDTTRYSLWMVPLFIPLALTILKSINDQYSIRKYFPVIITALLLLVINIYLTMEQGFVYTGYPLHYGDLTTDILIIQLVVMALIIGLIGLPHSRNLLRFSANFGKKRAFYTGPMRNVFFGFLIVTVLLSEIYFAPQFISKSELYKDNNLNQIGNLVSETADAI